MSQEAKSVKRYVRLITSVFVYIQNLIATLQTLFRSGEWKGKWFVTGMPDRNLDSGGRGFSSNPHQD